MLRVAAITVVLYLAILNKIVYRFGAARVAEFRMDVGLVTILLTNLSLR